MKTSKIILMACLLTVTVLISCTKEGPQGPKGDPGNPTVLVKEFTVVPSSNVNNGFAWNSTQSYYEHYENNLTELTQSVIDSGAVMLYLQTSNGWMGLPWSLVINSNTNSRSWVFAHNVNQIYIMVEQSGGEDQWTLGSSYKFKLIIIPNGTLRAYPGLDLVNYNSVKKAFNLTD